MDRLGFFGHPTNEAEVDALLSQLSDEHLMKLKVSSHSKYSKYPTISSEGENGSHKDDDDGVLDSELSKRLANLKVASLKQPSAAPRNKGKQTEAKMENGGRSSLTTSSSRWEDGNGGGGSDRRKLSRSQSHNSNSEFVSNISSGGDSLDDSEDIDANLTARFNALKGNPSPSSLDPSSLGQPSGRVTSHKGAASDYYSSSNGSSSPSATLLGRSSSRSSPRVINTSVATSCNCSTPSSFKLLKQLTSKKIPSKPAALPSSTSSDSSPAPSIQSTTSGKSVGKESNWKKKSHHKSQAAEAENLSTVRDVRRLLSSVADRVGLERNRVSSTEEDDCLGGDVRTFSMLDREQEYLKATSQEEKLNSEAERVVEWAKDAARLGLDTSDGENEDLELGEDDIDSDSSTDEHKRSAKGFKKAAKTKKKKKWGLF